MAVRSNEFMYVQQNLFNDQDKDLTNGQCYFQKITSKENLFTCIQRPRDIFVIWTTE